MVDHPNRQSEYREHLAWDVPTRLFHWINALAVLGLIATGLETLTGSLLGLSPDGKIALKSVHVLLGYVMAGNLLWRFVWAFFGNRYARWRRNGLAATLICISRNRQRGMQEPPSQWMQGDYLELLLSDPGGLAELPDFS